MKYIRMKDGRIIAFDTDKELPKYIHEKVGIFEHTTEIVKQADTIEELCDEFVIVCEDSSLNTTFKKLKEARIAGSYFECNHEYYGAIWTNKGLIYVAKMNDKGELELL